MVYSDRMIVHRVLALVGLAACGGTYGGSRPTTTPQNELPRDGIAAAGLPYTILDARTGHQVDPAEFWKKMASERAVCVGEEHPNPHHHWVQLEMVRQMERAKTTHLELGMEMVQRPFQGVLDDYAAGKIDAAALRSRAGWEDRWGYDYNLYGPTIDEMVHAHGGLLALNASRELTKKISHHGLESLTAEEKAQVPELDLKNAAHRAWFQALMEDMGGASAHSAKPTAGAGSGSDADKKEEEPPPAENPHEDPHKGMPNDEAHQMPSAERIYTVQVVWDETMADTSAKWLQANPQGHLVIMAGNGHCHDSGIVGRMKRRGVQDVVSIRPVIDDGGSVAELLAKPMNDYLVVLQMSPEMKKKEAASGAPF